MGMRTWLMAWRSAGELSISTNVPRFEFLTRYLVLYQPQTSNATPEELSKFGFLADRINFLWDVQEGMERARTRKNTIEHEKNTTCVTALKKTADVTGDNAVADTSEVLDEGAKSAFQHTTNVTDYKNLSENLKASFDKISSNEGESLTVTTKAKTEYVDTALNTKGKSRLTPSRTKSSPFLKISPLSKTGMAVNVRSVTIVVRLSAGKKSTKHYRQSCH